MFNQSYWLSWSFSLEKVIEIHVVLVAVVEQVANGFVLFIVRIFLPHAFFDRLRLDIVLPSQVIRFYQRVRDFDAAHVQVVSNSGMIFCPVVVAAQI